MRGPLHLLILKILTERPFSGSEIHEILKSKFELDIPSAAIYTILSALEERDLVSSRWETGERGPARKIYNVTEYGVEHLKNVIEEYKKFKRLFEFLIS
ncbi:MAG: PadR family transcriptional regulator [Candidatus Bathyarchaeia archaeon]